MERIIQEIFTPDYLPRHHAFLLTGEPFSLLPNLREQLVAQAKVPRGEINEVLTSKLTVDDSRDLKKMIGSPVAHSHRFLLIGLVELTEEAEQALLKLLEEPPKGLVIILICPPPANLRPTILSRLWRLGGGGEMDANFKFLTLTPADRLALINKELEKIAEEEASAKAYVLTVLSIVEQELEASLKEGVAAEKVKQAGEVLRNSRSLLSTSTRFSAKLFLEHLSLTLPRL